MYLVLPRLIYSPRCLQKNPKQSRSFWIPIGDLDSKRVSSANSSGDLNPSKTRGITLTFLELRDQNVNVNKGEGCGQHTHLLHFQIYWNRIC